MVLASTHLRGGDLQLKLVFLFGSQSTKKLLHTSIRARKMFGAMDRGYYFIVLFLVSILSASLHSCEAQLPQGIRNDMFALMAFKTAAGGGDALKSWNNNSNPCGTSTTSKWQGLECNGNGRVSGVLLSGLQLNGTFAENSLSYLSFLQALNLANNSFSGSFPNDLTKLRRLQILYAQNANFSGPCPNISQAVNISDVNLSGNHISGVIPSDISGLSNLRSLDLSINSLSGNIPELPQSLTSLNLSHNELNGTIPPDLAQKFSDPSIFIGNPELCGNPLSSTGVCAVSVSSPAPASGTNSPSPAPADSSKHGLKTMSIIFIVLGALLALLAIAFFLVKYLKKNGTQRFGFREKGPEKTGDDSVQAAMSTMGGGEGGDRSKLTFIDDESQHGYDLEDLLRASAEMLGKGSFGTAYKAVMESGMIVAVKRLRDVKEMSKKEFDMQMDTLGRLRHPNLVPLRAYYYAKEEKLLIYDFMPNGSLFSLLHGSRGPGRTPLEWPARLSIAQGVAQGLTYLHRASGSQKIPHGNIKSSNVLMGKQFEVCISDFGLVQLMPSQIAAQRMAGYRAPEYNYARKITHKADVYSFGVLLLELLTGRQPAQSINDNGIDLPKWVQSVVREEWTGEVFDLELKTYLHGEEEMVTLLQIAMSCVDPKPDERPEMAAVVDQLDGIRRGEVVDSDSYQSRSTEGDYSSRDITQGDFSSTSNLGTPIAD